ncbi:MAG: hypothetical protein ACE5HA_19225 [Anaerolineae bacterium]
MEGVLAVADSRNGVVIRLTHERWAHIVEAHDYMAGLHDWVLETVADPDDIIQGWAGSLIATRRYPETPITEKHLVVVYREIDSTDGFIITAFMTSHIEKVWKRGILWQRSK